jgi:hypothetical protein
MNPNTGWGSAAFVALSGLLAMTPLYGNDQLLSVHGFASQGFLKSSHNNYFGESTDGSFDLTELGLNARYTVMPSLDVAAQVVSRRAGELYDGDPRLDYAFFDYRFRSTGSGVAGVRAGRVKVPFGFYNETRDVPATRPGILLPQSIYIDGLGIRDFYTGADGILGYWNHFSGRSSWQIDLGVAVPTTIQNETKAAFLRTLATPGDMELESGQVARLLYERDGGSLRLAGTLTRVRSTYSPGSGDPFGPGSIPINSLVLSAELNQEQLSITAEATVRAIETRGFGPALPDTSLNEGGYYVQATYRPVPGWETFLRYDTHWNDLDDRSGRKQSAAFSALPGIDRAPHRFFQRQWTLGAGWQVTSNWLLRAEWHHIHGTALTPLPDNPEFDQGGGTPRWDLLALQASFTF